MITNTTFLTEVPYFPLGNTSPVLLTQDLPPEQDADILLLGCGDARSILFTCLVDSTPRRLDITCCDIEPGIQARNVLLYSLLIDDESNLHVDRIWNIYYHLMLDSESLELLESQIEKLQRLSASLDKWHESLYGSTIRFYDEKSLSRVKSYWSNFSSQGLTPASNEKRLRQLQDAYARAKSSRTHFLGKGLNLTGSRATLPATYAQAPQDFSEIADYWWTHGTLPLHSGPASKSIHLNPSFFYSPNSALMLDFAVSPLLGFPLSIANTPIKKTCPLSIEKNGLSSKDRLVASAKCLFSNWASAFRRKAEKTLLIRIFCGDAVHFCFTLASECDNDPPTKFDYIDTSNLGDLLGPLNLIALGSVLLKKHPSSSLYTEMLVQHYSNVKDRFTESMGCDVRTVALLLGLVCPDLFINTTNCIEEDSVNIESVKMKTGRRVSQERSRFRWKRINSEPNEAAYMHAEAETLAKFFIDIYYEMFIYERPMEAFLEVETMLDKFLRNSANPRYNRGSFAFLLSIVRSHVSTDWDKCVKLICDEVCWSRVDPFGLYNLSDELLLHMQFFGVYCSGALKLEPKDLSNDLIASALNLNEKSPDTLCVTIRVPRENLKVIMSQSCRCPIIVCSITGKDQRGSQWESSFSSIYIAFGEWSERSDKNSSNLCFVEDSRQQSGTSDMFASFFVPTNLLLKSKQSIPVVRCQLLGTYSNIALLDELGLDLCLVRKEITSNDVSISQFVPGMSALPSYLAFNLSRTTASDLVTLRFSDDSSKVKTLVKRIDLQSDAAKVLAVKSSAVKIEFRSPLLAIVTVANSFKFEFRFPCPVSISSKNYKVRFGRTSSFIEVESPLLDPLDEDIASFMFPTFLANATSNLTLPTSWIATYIDMDAMPQIDTTKIQKLEWLKHHLCFMFSEREEPSSKSCDTRTELKRRLFSIIAEFTGTLGKKIDMFELKKKDSPVETIIIPSCLRLDLVNQSVVLDCALIPHSPSTYNDNLLDMFLLKIAPTTFVYNVGEAENRAWKALMPAFTERCRTNTTWTHGPNCEYVKAGEIPLAAALFQSNLSPICTCGVGKFPAKGYLDKLKEKFPELNYVLKRYATRVAIAPVFSVPYVEEDCFPVIGDIINSMDTIDKCQSCGCSKRKNHEEKQNSLLTCARCKSVKYCSADCQKADWKRHKLSCGK